MRKFIFLITIIYSTVCSAQIKLCTDVEEKFVRNKLKLSKNAKSYIPFELAEYYKGVCKVYAPQMMDGLAFVLYKKANTNNYFVGLYNGLDGSYKMHGPFSK